MFSSIPETLNFVIPGNKDLTTKQSFILNFLKTCTNKNKQVQKHHLTFQGCKTASSKPQLPPWPPTSLQTWKQ